MGPIGRTHVSFERVQTSKPFSKSYYTPYLFLNVNERQGLIQDPESKKLKKQEIALKRPNQLALSIITNPSMVILYKLREYIRGWRFYSSFNIANEKIRKSVPIEQEPVLHEDAGNLSSVLHYLMTEHQEIFDEMQQHLKSAIPGFKGLTVKARGGYWTEEGLDQGLSLADLSDGILRMICWATLCILPNPPSLICIDGPDQGVHPRTLPILAGLFEKACERTIFFLDNHASYFLMQFELNRVAVMRKENGDAKFIKSIDSKVLNENLKDFGPEEIEIMHRSDELEKFA